MSHQPFEYMDPKATTESRTISGHFDSDGEGLQALLGSAMHADMTRSTFIFPNGSRWWWRPMMTGRILIDDVNEVPVGDGVTASIEWHFVDGPHFGRIGFRRWFSMRVVLFLAFCLRVRAAQRLLHEQDPSARFFWRTMLILTPVVLFFFIRSFV